MTNPVKLLSDDEVVKIAARKKAHEHGNIVLLSVGERDALCQTVRALRESETFWQERTRARTTEVEQLQSQLAQVTQERDDLRKEVEFLRKEA